MSTMPFESRNPASGEVIATFEPHDTAAIEVRLARAAHRSISWKETPITERAALLHRLADQLETDSDRLSRLMTLEDGEAPARGQG